MKYDIKNVDYDGRPVENGAWWVWNERCDRCGCQIRTHSVMSSEEPNIEEADFCTDCIGDFIDGGIPYHVAATEHIDWLKSQHM